MKKISIILTIIILSALLIFNNNKHIKYIKYNGYKLALSVNGEQVTTIPTGNYFLVSYTCLNGTTLNWDYQTSKLTSNNPHISDTCSLTFESSPTLYNLANIGDYIAYTGDSTNGCTEPQCSGFNANQLETETGEFDLYGYCIYKGYQFNTYGWRVLYKNNNSVYIVSAGAPECITETSEYSTDTITNLNSAALKYCNIKYLSEGLCNETTAHPFKNNDFYNFTNQYYETGNFLYKYNDGGNPYCGGDVSKKCGYNNDIIDNGGFYWFASSYNVNKTLFWTPRYRGIYIHGILGADDPYDMNDERTYGLRPVLKLDASIKATGGSGTMDDPYTISERDAS